MTFEEQRQAETVWVDDRHTVEPTPRGEWVVVDNFPNDGFSGIRICPVGNAFFPTKEAALEFANR